MKLTAHVEDTCIIFIAEQLALQYLISEKVQHENCKSMEWLPILAFFQEMECSLKESLRSLLREPLRNRTFFTNFVSHFKTHEVPQIREIA